MSVGFPPWPKNADAWENLWTGGVNGPPSLGQKTSPPKAFPKASVAIPAADDLTE